MNCRELEDTLDSLTGFEDVLFSIDVDIPALPPHSLARSGKRVYLAEGYVDLRTILAPVEGDYDVCLLYPTDDSGWMSWAAGLEHQAWPAADHTLISIDKSVWLQHLVDMGGVSGSQYEVCEAPFSSSEASSLDP